MQRNKRLVAGASSLKDRELVVSTNMDSSPGVTHNETQQNAHRTATGSPQTTKQQTTIWPGAQSANMQNVWTQQLLDGSARPFTL